MACPPEPPAATVEILRLLAENDVPAPDAVEHRHGEVVLLWHDRKLAVVVELDVAG